MNRKVGRISLEGFVQQVLTICKSVLISVTYPLLCLQLSYTALCPSCNLEQDFLQQAIASHLMTFGRSIIVGRVPERVNKVS